jgi:teichuronic acid exporter
VIVSAVIAHVAPVAATTDLCTCDYAAHPDNHPYTIDILGTLQRSAVSATMWSGVGSVGRTGLHFATTVALARLLSPEEFGIVALLSVFTGVAGVFVDSGFSCALVQKRELTERDTSTVFYFSLLSSGVFAGLLCLAAPAIAVFFKVPALKSITYVIAATMIVGALGSVHSVILNKTLDFKSQAAIEVTARVVSGGLAIYLAWSGWGVWSLVAQVVAGSVVTTGLLWTVLPWRPQRVFDIGILRSMFAFGSYILATNLLDAVYGRINALLIGKQYSLTSLGIYSRADSTQQLPTSLLTETVNRVAFPLFSAANQDLETLRRGLRKALGGVMLLNLPAMFALIAIARPLFQSVFGPQWMESTRYFQILCLGGVFYPVNRLNASVLVAQGHSDLYLRLEGAKKIVGLLAIVCASQISIAALAWSQVFTTVCAYALSAYYTGKCLRYPLVSQVRDLVPCVLATAIMFTCIQPWPAWQVLPPVQLLGIQVTLGVSAYVVACRLLRVQAFEDMLDILRTLSVSMLRQKPAPAV